MLMMLADAAPLTPRTRQLVMMMLPARPAAADGHCCTNVEHMSEFGWRFSSQETMVLCARRGSRHSRREHPPHRRPPELRSRAMSEAEAVIRNQSGYINHTAKKDYGPLEFTGRIAGGLRLDLRRRLPLYASDWTDAFKPENFQKSLSSILYLFIAALAPAITFGSRFLDGTNGQFGVLEMIMSTAVSGVIFSTFAGQPLSILGATGPFLAYTLVVYDMAVGADVEFMPFYFWVCMWCSLFTILVAVFDLCALMKHVTMFSEDIFAGLISLIFIIDGVRPAAREHCECCAVCACMHVRASVREYTPESTCARARAWLGGCGAGRLDVCVCVCVLLCIRGWGHADAFCLCSSPVFACRNLQQRQAQSIESCTIVMSMRLGGDVGNGLMMYLSHEGEDAVLSNESNRVLFLVVHEGRSASVLETSWRA